MNDFVLHRLNGNQSVDEFFYTIDELLIRCTYNRMNCSAADFVSFQTSHHGLCHTFNAKTNRIRNGSLFAATENGDDGVLKLHLYSHGNQNIPDTLDGRTLF